MDKLPSKQRERLARKIREGKDKLCPGRGGCGKFAAMLGISPNLLSQWMNGKRQPTPQQLAHLAKLFKVPIQTLCSLPKVKHDAASTALDVILDLTKARKKVKPSPKTKKVFARKTHEIKSYLEKELEDF